jgi:hypothetical protein
MSHFTVLVIGNDPEKQLQPYHEYECTRIEDEYVIDVDYTDKIKEDLERELFVGKKKDSEDYDYEYYEERAKENFVSYEKMTRNDYFKLSETDIDKYIAEDFGVEKKDGVWYRKTNPNSKWDWYQLGGRWSGAFKLKQGAKGETGSPGLMSSPAEEGWVDQAKKCDIDFEGMRNDAQKRAEESYDKAMQYIGDISEHEIWNSLRERFEKDGKTIDEARTAYHAQPRCVAWNKIEDKDFRYGYEVDGFSKTREEYIENARNNAVSSFAVVKDSKWYEKGKMGWWAMVSDEKDKNEWSKQFSALIDSVSDDTMFSMYDCHI